MDAARALGRTAGRVLLLLALGAAAGGAWPATGGPSGSSGPGSLGAGGAVSAWIDPWAEAWAGSVQRLDDFAVFLVADAGQRWREAAGDLARWGQQALPRLEGAVVTARRAVAASSDVAAPIWRQLQERLAGWWPPRPPAPGPGGAAPGPAEREGSDLMPPGSGAPSAARVAAGEVRSVAPPESLAAPPGTAGGAVVASDPVHLIPDPAQRAAELASQQGAASPAAEADPADPRTPATAGTAPAGNPPGETRPADEDRSAPAAAAAEPRPPATRGDGEAGGSGTEGGAGERGSPRPAAAAAGDRAQEGWTAAVASWYGPGFYGRPTASGEIFTGRELTAAHRTLPFGTVLLVRYPETGRSVQVRINDRGPYVEGRDLDLSEAAAEALGMIAVGVAPVVYRVVRWGE